MSAGPLLSLDHLAPVGNRTSIKMTSIAFQGTANRYKPLLPLLPLRLHPLHRRQKYLPNFFLPVRLPHGFCSRQWLSLDDVGFPTPRCRPIAAYPTEAADIYLRNSSSSAFAPWNMWMDGCGYGAGLPRLFDGSITYALGDQTS